MIKNLQSDCENITVSSNYGNEIEDVKIMGRDNYIVARTSDTLIIGDLQRNTISEVAYLHIFKPNKYRIKFILGSME